MIRELAIIRESAALAAKAALGVTEALRQGRVQQETAFTDRMIGAIENAMNGFCTHGICWTAMTLTDRGPGAQEKKYGADFAGVLKIELVDFTVKKGFLGQAKLIEPNVGMEDAEMDRLKEQCGKMLDVTSAAFVFLYSRRSIRVVPAISVMASARGNPHDLYSRSLSRFFEEHFSCFIGDRRIDVPNADALAKAAVPFYARGVLYLEAGMR